MLAGLMSRWTRPWAWAADRADGDLDADLGDPAGQQGALGAEDVAQVPALDQLHDHEVGAVVLAPVVDGDDVGVGEVGGGLGLAAEALDERLAGGELAVEDLDRDLAAEAPVLRRRRRPPSRPGRGGRSRA